MGVPFETVRGFMVEQGRVSDVDALWSLLLAYFAHRDIPLVSYHHMAPPGSDAPVTGIRAHGFPEDWVCHYIDQRLYRVDPIPDFALRSTRPFFWSEAVHITGLLAEQQAFLGELAATGIGDGLAVQVFGPQLRNGYFGLGFGKAHRAVSADAIAEYQMVCQIAHLRYCDLVPSTPVQPLSPREREVLYWVARGKSNAAIAGILDVSSHTVDAYMRRIYAKLSVSDRTTAVIRGIGSGMLRGER
ncbi:MAG: LuxR family transcriptional regulator [Pseudomonadota bacterium]